MRAIWELLLGSGSVTGTSPGGFVECFLLVSASPPHCLSAFPQTCIRGDPEGPPRGVSHMARPLSRGMKETQGGPKQERQLVPLASTQHGPPRLLLFGGYVAAAWGITGQTSMALCIPVAQPPLGKPTPTKDPVLPKCPHFIPCKVSPLAHDPLLPTPCPDLACLCDSAYSECPGWDGPRPTKMAGFRSHLPVGDTVHRHCACPAQTRSPARGEQSLLRRTVPCRQALAQAGPAACGSGFALSKPLAGQLTGGPS